MKNAKSYKIIKRYGRYLGEYEAILKVRKRFFKIRYWSHIHTFRIRDEECVDAVIGLWKTRFNVELFDDRMPQWTS